MGKDISLREHQLIMLDILKEFATFCDKNGLRYFLDAGTLLGAVRHQGFIPWDNDMDVCMPRPDFDKFINLLSMRNNKLNDHIFLEKPEDSIFTFYKLSDSRTQLIEYPDRYPVKCFVYIDLFCKDGLPKNLKTAKHICDKSGKMALWHWFYKFSIPCWSREKNVLRKIVAKLANFFVKNKNRAIIKQKKFIKKVNKKYPYEKCEYVVTLSNGEFYRICKKIAFDDYVLANFEGNKFRIPAGYNEWLTVLYGQDYMIPPKKDKQVVHDAIVTWKDDNHKC